MTENQQPVFDKQLFWQFSCEFYQQKGVERACLTLQNEYGLNVNLTLFLLWYAVHAQKVIQTKQLESVLDAITIADERVQAFRNFRKQFWDQIPESEKSAMHDVQQSLLDTELTLESKVQAGIIHYANQHLIVPPNVQSIIEHPIELDFVAHENLDIYCRYLHPESQPQLFDLQQRLVSALIQFPLHKLAA